MSLLIQSDRVAHRVFEGNGGGVSHEANNNDVEDNEDKEGRAAAKPGCSLILVLVVLHHTLIRAWGMARMVS